MNVVLQTSCTGSLKATAALSIVAGVLTASSASGELVSVELAELAGPYQGFQDRGADFSFPNGFESVESVSLEITATATPLMYDECGTILLPEPCTLVVQPVGFIGTLLPPTGLATFSVAGFSEAETTGSDIVSSLFGGGPLSDALGDGAGELFLSLDAVVIADDVVVMNVVPATAQVAAAVLTFDAIPAPEPSADSLSVLSVLMLVTASYARRALAA